MVQRDMMKKEKRKEAKRRANQKKKKVTMARVVEGLSSLKSSSEVKQWQQHSKFEYQSL